MSGPASLPLIADIQGLKIDYVSKAAVAHAVQGASIRIAEGETVGIVGESGSGKSTIARSLLGLLNPRLARIVGGKIILGSQDVTNLSPRAWERLRGNPVAMVFQDPLTYLNPVMTISAQIEESIHLHDRESATAPRLTELLDLVKLPRHVLPSYPDEMSGGMRQRVLLAIALGCRPRLLVADEPTTALDVTTQAEIMELLQDLRKYTGMAMLLISHDLDLVASNCERIYVMYSGQTIEWGSASDIFNAPSHPYTRGLLAAAEGMRQQDGSFVTIPGDPPDLRVETRGCPFLARCPESFDACRDLPGPTQAGAPNHAVRCFAVQRRSLHPGGIPA
jgi:oligopeptide/dipeptide ABC transporter ATP-binding protein